MSLQWVLIAGFLYAEIVLVLLLSSPIASPSKWHKLFKSRFLKVLIHQLSKYFNFILFALVLFLCDSIRELRKYSEISAEEKDKYANLDAEMLIELRLFRAQRNFYVCGFTLVLSVVIRRMITLISEQAEVLKSVKAQSQVAGQNAKTDLDSQNRINDTINRNNELTNKLVELEQELKREKKHKEAMMSQSESVKREYDRLLSELTKVAQPDEGNNKVD